FGVVIGSKVFGNRFVQQGTPASIYNVGSENYPSQIKTAYKKLIRLWHPDINKNPYATQMTSRINVAYEQYKSIHRSSCVENEKGIKIDSRSLIRKILEGLKLWLLYAAKLRFTPR
ncbi:MAG: DnaJ domain-containing protein, partial [Moorea sp. SIO2B7]|nr:DnaJ domain-containing protein [Moorena sp. SIO2B7]